MFGDAKPSQIHVVLISAVPTCAGDEFQLNYVKEAEIARSYHWLIDHGIPAENIILFMNGNFANNTEQNPYPGALYSDPERSRNYAEGLQIDYSGEEVNSENFLAVIQGEKDKVNGGSGRVLNSSESDHVFISHEGHGGPGFLMISSSGVLTSKVLTEALKDMDAEKKFKKLIYYIMACHSGSMFSGKLEPSGNIYAFTAANPELDAHPKDLFEATLKDAPIVIYVNSQFGDGWMDYAESVSASIKHDTKKSTLDAQYENVRPQVDSDATRYGNMEIGKHSISDFQGLNDGPNSQAKPKPKFGSSNIKPEGRLPIAPIAKYMRLKQKLAKMPPKQMPERSKYLGSRGTQLMRSQKSPLELKVEQLESEQNNIKKSIASIVKSFVEDKNNFNSGPQHLNKVPSEIKEVNCHHEVIQTVWHNCPVVIKSPFINDFIVPIVNLCEQKYPTDKIVEQVKKNCS
ncbi:Legumain [Aphelenchoides bicaudatus]|nr:Legumain [Aphelenchoides bicaudatus]